MADTKLTALTETTAPVTTDDVYIVTTPGGTPASKRCTIANLTKAMKVQVQLAQTVVGVSGAADITFSTISGTYTNLRIIISGRGDNVGTSQGCVAQFNADTGNNYDWQYSRAHATTLVGAEQLAGANIYLGDMPCAGAPAGAAGQIVVDIAGYSGATFQKTLFSNCNLKVATTTGNIWIQMHTGWWRNTAAITEVKLFLVAGNFAQGTIATLYGLP